MSGQNIEEIVRQRVTEPEVRTEIKLPRKYKVVLLNDDYTPMDFVVDVLKHFFILMRKLLYR